jgi:hypothetical protein
MTWQELFERGQKDELELKASKVMTNPSTNAKTQNFFVGVKGEYGKIKMSTGSPFCTPEDGAKLDGRAFLLTKPAAYGGDAYRAEDKSGLVERWSLLLAVVNPEEVASMRWFFQEWLPAELKKLPEDDTFTPYTLGSVPFSEGGDSGSSSASVKVKIAIPGTGPEGAVCPTTYNWCMPTTIVDEDGNVDAVMKVKHTFKPNELNDREHVYPSASFGIRRSCVRPGKQTPKNPGNIDVYLYADDLYRDERDQMRPAETRIRGKGGFKIVRDDAEATGAASAVGDGFGGSPAGSGKRVTAHSDATPSTPPAAISAKGIAASSALGSAFQSLSNSIGEAFAGAAAGSGSAGSVGGGAAAASTSGSHHTYPAVHTDTSSFGPIVSKLVQNMSTGGHAAGVVAK